LKATDLICEKCGTGARDVDLSMEFDDKTTVHWTCQNGHQQISGWRPEITGLSAVLTQDYPSYQTVLIDTAALQAEMDTKGREQFIDKLEERIDAMHNSAVARLSEGIFYSPPVYFGREWPKPSHWKWRAKFRWWWRDAREWLAVKVLRVDIYQGSDE
jgi:hypothetical protein